MIMKSVKVEISCFLQRVIQVKAVSILQAFAVAKVNLVDLVKSAFLVAWAILVIVVHAETQVEQVILECMVILDRKAYPVEASSDLQEQKVNLVFVAILGRYVLLLLNSMNRILNYDIKFARLETKKSVAHLNGQL